MAACCYSAYGEKGLSSRRGRLSQTNGPAVSPLPPGAQMAVAVKACHAVCRDILHFSARVLVSSAGQFRQFGHGRLTRSQPEP